MVISGPAKRCGQISSCSVNCLPLIFKVDSSGDFGDQDWCEVLGSVFFVDAQIINFGHLDFIVFDKS